MFEGKYIYNIGFIGAFDSTRINVVAGSVKEAKKIFADYHGIVVSRQIIARKHDVISLNEDCRKQLSSYYAKHPEGYREKVGAL